MGLKGWRVQVSSLGVKGGGNGTIAYEKKFYDVELCCIPMSISGQFWEEECINTYIIT